jgi:pimeloyl-ACP methyl ester carboxylesterase
MLRRTLMKIVLLGSALVAAPVLAQSEGETSMSTGRIPVNGVDIYYEIHGEGAPLVMLHGGVNPSEMFGDTLTQMAKTHRVIAIHLRGHGLSGDTDAPWTYEQMADDVAALLAETEFGKADFMGYSTGAGVAIQTAIRHPEAVGRLVLVSATVAAKGEYPEIRAAFDQLPQMAAAIGENIAKSPLGNLYPDRDWETVMRKTGEQHQPLHDWSDGFAKIEGPILMIYADADSIRPEAITGWYALRGGGQRDGGLDGSGRSPSELAIIPSKTHYTILTSPAVTTFAEAFLGGGA